MGGGGHHRGRDYHRYADYVECVMVNGGSVSGGARIWWLPFAGYGRGLRGDRLQGCMMAETASCGSWWPFGVREGCVLF